MLIKFSLKNHKSIKDKQSLSMVAKTSDDSLYSENVFSPQLKHGSSIPRLVRTAAIYGANASGKSNFLNGLRTMERIVLNSAGYRPDGLLPVKPYLLDDEFRTQPSEFEVTFLVDGIHYQYGFSATRERIVEEWLLAFPEGRAQTWFHRLFEKETSSYKWRFSPRFKGDKRQWQKATRPNALFLSSAVSLNSEQLLPVYKWFSSTLGIVDGLVEKQHSMEMCKNDKGTKESVLKFLKCADFRILDIEVESSRFLSKFPSEDLPKELRSYIDEAFKNEEFLEAKTFHKKKNGGMVAFDLLMDESTGTNTIFSLAAPWLDSLLNGYVLLVDELHNSLHPLLVRFLIELFQGRSNNKNAQLIFTTHQTAILTQDLFRRDQIWFSNRQEEGCTDLYPLTDFSPRKGKEDLEAAYLGGRYGALPYITQGRSEE